MISNLVSTKYVYSFGNKEAEGDKSMKNLLGGKGANLAEMSLLCIPVPPGFTITTDACTAYYQQDKAAWQDSLHDQLLEGIKSVENATGFGFGNPDNPLLLSVRSGARVSMPGMMDTVLNLGINDEVVVGFARQTNNPRAAWDSYRRFIQMYGDVVMGLKPDSKEEMDPFEKIIDEVKNKKGICNDTELTVADLQELCHLFSEKIKEKTGQ